jgi:hypothetical protein
VSAIIPPPDVSASCLAEVQKLSEKIQALLSEKNKCIASCRSHCFLQGQLQASMNDLFKRLLVTNPTNMIVHLDKAVLSQKFPLHLIQEIGFINDLCLQCDVSEKQNTDCLKCELLVPRKKIKHGQCYIWQLKSLHRCIEVFGTRIMKYNNMYEDDRVYTLTLAAPWGRSNSMSTRRGIILKVHSDFSVDLFYPILATDKSEEDNEIQGGVHGLPNLKGNIETVISVYVDDPLSVVFTPRCVCKISTSLCVFDSSGYLKRGNLICDPNTLCRIVITNNIL